MKLLSLSLSLVFLLSSIAPGWSQVKKAPAKNTQDETCENGECIESLVVKLKKLNTIYVNQCLPKNIKPSAIAAYHETHGFTESCWKIITEIKHLESQLAKHQARLEQKLGCASGDCKQGPSNSDDLSSKLKSITKVQNDNVCSVPKQLEVKKQCSSDVNCALMSTAFTTGGYLAEMIVPKNWKPNGCHLGDDNCTTQLATGFLKSAFTFFESVWDLLKMAGKKTGEGMSKFWNWVTDAEDHASTSQLALAKASEDEGFFKMLTNDFPGTMKKMWEGFVAALKEWMKTDVFCQKWSGVPHFGTCLKPTNNFDCLSCKALINGTCAMTGIIVAEIVPAFFTGGLTSAAKYGAQGAGKIAKLFKVSSSSLKVIESSKIGQAALKASTKVDDILRVSQGLKAAKLAVEGALRVLNTYMLAPVRSLTKSSWQSLASLSKKGTSYIAQTSAGKILVFSGKVAKGAAKVIIYPIDNPMLTASFKSGQRSFDKLFKLGPPKLLTPASSLAAEVIKRDPLIESALIKVEAARIAPKTQIAEITSLEFKALEQMVPIRKEAATKFLSESDDLDDVIKHLYPELQYSSVSKAIGIDKTIAGEKELWHTISRLPDGPIKETLLTKYYERINNNSLRKLMLAEVNPRRDQILANSALKPEDRVKEALLSIKRVPSSELEASKLAHAIEEAHLAGTKETFQYSWRELREKYRILTDAGFTSSEADELIRLGIVGRPPVRELVTPGKTLFNGFAEDIVDATYLERRNELIELLKAKDSSPGFFEKLFDHSAQSEVVKDNLDSLHFIDYSHSARKLETIVVDGSKMEDVPLRHIYNETAFKNFKETRKWLLEDKPDLSKETLLGIHKRMIDGVADFGEKSDLGVLRRGDIMGNVPQQFAISSEVLAEINSNPYLSWKALGQTFEKKHFGHIHYPNAKNVSSKTLNIIRTKKADLVATIEEMQVLPAKILAKKTELQDNVFSETIRIRKKSELDILEKRHQELHQNYRVVNQELVESLVDDLMDWFTRERTLIGDINSPEKLDDYVSLLADFQKRLVSIHPLTDGNGRSSREFISYALMKEGFPPPRILDPNADLYTSLDDWKKMIKHGILASDFLMDDMIERLKFGLPIENSTDLMTPYTRPPVKMSLKGEKKVPTMDGVEYIDPRLYRELVKRLVKENPNLTSEIVTSPVQAWDKINKKIDEVFSKNNIYYKHAKNGIERVEVGYVDSDFKILFGKSSFDNQELFNFKMKSWYSDDINWRGLASKHKSKSEEEIIDMFKNLNSHMASNAVVRKISNRSGTEAIKEAAFEDFDKLNNDIFGDGLVNMARDHSETGPMYGISYGYSTSKSREVGKAFAMGAMVVGKYGEHKLPELQALLKSRVLVGAKKSVKDIDLGRLKQVRPEFSYKYGRQQEVMGVGASDPDAVTIIQTIDAKGEVTLTYLRNPDKANEIWVIKGDIDPGARPNPEQLVKTMTLTR